MTTAVNVGDLFQGGRVASIDPTIGKAYLRFAQVLTTDTYEFHFPTAVSTALTFGVPASVFIDNSLNAFELDVAVMATRQTFPVPANSTGWYAVDSLPGSTITVQSAGIPVGPVEIIFYNYPQTPFVYYKFGLNSVEVAAIPNGADVAQGSTTDPAVTNPALPATVISLLKGILTVLNGILANTGAYIHTRINTNTTTAVKAAAGTFGGLSINVAGAAGSVIVYDSLSGSGTIVAEYNSAVAGSFPLGQGVQMTTGITVVTTGAPDITVLSK